MDSRFRGNDGPRRGGGRDYFAFATIVALRLPICGDLISTLSPIFRNRSGGWVPSGLVGLESAAVPSPVPLQMRSPGFKVRSRDRYSRYCAKENVISFVLCDWRRSPLTKVS